MKPWSVDAWRTAPNAQPIAYPDPAALDDAARRLAALPPLVTSWEIERLKQQLAEAQEGTRFVLQGGDCAETFTDCTSAGIANKLKILLQMSIVLIDAAHVPVVRIGRFAGQYAKPRSKPTEVQGGVELPSYMGDLVNRPAFEARARAPDPELLLSGHHHAAMTLNFVRSLVDGGFADMHHPENWDLSFFERADLPPDLRAEYQRTTGRLGEALRFVEALGETSIDDLSRVEFFTSHEGLNLHYEAANTRTVPRREGHYCLTAHLPWIGERTRALDGAHIAFFRGITNPLGLKLGPSTTPDELRRLLDTLNPENEAGRMVLITRFGAANVQRVLPKLAEAVRSAGAKVLWVCDPMHGNTHATPSGLKTRDTADIFSEVATCFDVHRASGTRLGGVHLELTGEDVTECIGGGLTESDLDRNYATACDPRLNYRQSLELAFRLAAHMRDGRRVNH
ncbi:MAG: 3-deoxy-7-phosphoheptulonate synthase [Archangium sp.]|nr:3-deoxy-7-phosphoheptulonate synthase [Archangium sp.]